MTANRRAPQQVPFPPPGGIPAGPLQTAGIDAMSFTQRILVGLAAGIFVGLFLGEHAVALMAERVRGGAPRWFGRIAAFPISAASRKDGVEPKDVEAARREIGKAMGPGGPRGLIALVPGWRATAHRPAQVLRSE